MPPEGGDDILSPGFSNKSKAILEICQRIQTSTEVTKGVKRNRGRRAQLHKPCLQQTPGPEAERISHSPQIHYYYYHLSKVEFSPLCSVYPYLAIVSVVGHLWHVFHQSVVI